MITVDYLVIACACVFAVVGAAMGFGRCLRVLNKGVVGRIVTVIVTYYLLGIVLTLDVTKNAQIKFIEFLTAKNNGLCDFLLIIKSEVIVVALVVFFAVMLIQTLITSVVSAILGSQGKGVKLLNGALGAALSLVEFIALLLLVLEVVYLFSGAESEIYGKFVGSYFGLDEIYLNNPLSVLVKQFTAQLA